LRYPGECVPVMGATLETTGTSVPPPAAGLRNVPVSCCHNSRKPEHSEISSH
jgi:hypothetical protein